MKVNPYKFFVLVKYAIIATAILLGCVQTSVGQTTCDPQVSVTSQFRSGLFCGNGTYYDITVVVDQILEFGWRGKSGGDECFFNISPNNPELNPELHAQMLAYVRNTLVFSSDNNQMASDVAAAAALIIEGHCISMTPVEYCIPSTDIPQDAQTVTIGIRDQNGDRYFEIPIGELEREIGVCLSNYHEVMATGNYTATHRFDWVDPTPDPNDPFIPEPPPDGTSDNPLSVYILGQPIAVTLSDQPISVIVQNELQATFDDSSIIQGLTSVRNEVASQALATRNDMNQNNTDLINAIDENHLEIKDKMDEHFGILTNIMSKGSDTYGDSDADFIGIIQSASQLEIAGEPYQAISWNPSNTKECSYSVNTGLPFIGQISINLCDIPLIPNIRAMLLVFVTITQYLFFFFLAMQVFKVVK